MSPCLRVRALTSRETGQLQQLIRSSLDARVVRRAQIIRLSARGKTPNEIADILERSCSGIRKIINRFNAEGFPSLADKHRGGRPRKTDDRYVGLLKEAVQANPRDLGYPFSCWTLARLREHLARRTKIVLSLPPLARLMAEHQIVYRRPKHGMAHLRDPQEYDEKKVFLEFLKKGRCSPPRRSSCFTSMSVRYTSTQP